VLNGDAHHSSVKMRIELRIRPLPRFQRLERARGYHKMPLTISDEDQPDRTDGSRFRVIVYLPRFIERLIERLRRWIGGA
jgi:hypothetical protein